MIGDGSERSIKIRSLTSRTLKKNGKKTLTEENVHVSVKK